MKTLAVIMTARDVAPYVVEAVRSVQVSAARVRGWRVELRIGVDACRETAQALDRAGISYHWNATRAWSFVLRNSLIGLAPADAYVSFDADDVMLPACLPAVCAALTDDNIVGLGREEVDGHLRSAEPPVTRWWRCRGGSCALSAGALAILGGYWGGHPTAMDSEMTDRAQKAGIPWVALDEVLFLRRRNPRSVTQTVAKRGTTVREKAVAAIEGRRAEKDLIHVEPVTVPLEWRARVPVCTGVHHVAVIIAAWRATRWIGPCLESVDASVAALGRDAAVDVRVGVDGCEETALVLEALGRPYYWSAENVGAYVMRNSLVAAAYADAYVMFDADDVMLPDFLPKMVRGLRCKPIVGPSRIEVDEALQPRLPGGRHTLYRHGVCGVRHDAWATLGGFRAERFGADSDFIARADMRWKGQNGLRQVRVERMVITEPVYLRRRHPESLTQAPDTGRQSDARYQARQRMGEQRAAGVWRNEPVTVPLEWRAGT